MINKVNRFLVMDILHRLEVKESVSVDELMYLYKQIKESPEVERWVRKLFSSSKLISSQIDPPNNLFAA